MSRKNVGDQAQGWLTEHLERLDELRNARARDTSFKQWRQSTLTVIQRAWPNDPAKAERFRRITFTPASNKATDRALHDAYDAGCREARKLLKLWIAEAGLLASTEAPRGKAPTEAKKPGKAPKASLKSMLDFDDLEEKELQEPSAIPPAEAVEDPRRPSPTAPVSRAISALVYELPRLGVPEESREFLRGALLDIANRFEFGELTWGTMQELVFLAMQHPAIGRRILPLIVPYLDKAA